MKSTKQLLIIITLILMTMSCSTTSETFWVRGVKTPCDMGAGKGECLNVYKGSSLDMAEWTNFYDGIEGFEFKPGVTQKIRVTKKKLKKSEIPADGSAFKYSLEKVLESEEDKSSEIAGKWVVTTINGNPINRMAKLPFIHLDVENKHISGFDGCNNLNGMIENISSVNIKMGPIAATKKMCVDMTVADAFQKALNTVVAYDLQEGALNMYDDNRNIVLTFLPFSDQTDIPDDRINSEWDAIRINGNPINRMAVAPHILISTSKKMFIGTNGCNSFSAYITHATSKNIQVKQPAIDQKMCKDMSVPDAFNKALLKVSTYKVEGDQLLLYNANGDEVLAFLVSPKKN